LDILSSTFTFFSFLLENQETVEENGKDSSDEDHVKNTSATDDYISRGMYLIFQQTNQMQAVSSDEHTKRSSDVGKGCSFAFLFLIEKDRNKACNHDMENPKRKR